MTSSNRFQAIAWEGVDVKSTAQEFYTSLSPFERGDLLVENLYDGEANFTKATRGTAQQRMRATSERVDVFAVRVAGRRTDGQTAFVELRGFRPYFYVHVETVPAYRLLVDAVLEDYRFKHISIEIVDKIPFVGYHARPEKYLRFDCNSKNVFGNLKRFLKSAHDNLACLQGEKLTLYESMCDPVVQYHIANRIHPMTWMETGLAVGNVFDTKDVRFFPACVDSAPFKCIHYDLECFSSVAWSCGKNQMPNPNLDPDVIIGIGAVVSTTNNSAPEERFYFGIHPLKTDDASFEDARVFAYASEAEMLVGFCTWLAEADPDMWNAFNNFGFDDNFLVKRMQRYLYDPVGGAFVANDVPEFRTLRQRGLKDLFETYFPNRNKIHFGGCEQLRTQLKQKTFMSSAFQFEANYLHMPLRVYSDLLIFARREWKSKMNKFSLENVSRVLLNKGKHDVSPRDIFEAWAESSEPKLTTVGAYCIQDCALVAELMASQKIYSSILSRAELFLCDPRDLMLKGQQQIVFNLIYNQVRTQTNFCIPDSVDEAMDDFVVRDDSDDDSDGSGSDSDGEVEPVVAAASAGAGGAPVNAFARLRSPTAKDMKEPPKKKPAPRAAAVEGDDDFVPAKKKAFVKIKFKGATVLEPKRAPYAYMAPISGLDFARYVFLYPTHIVDVFKARISYLHTNPYFHLKQFVPIDHVRVQPVPLHTCLERG
jgi:hypothetical protein